MSSVGTGSALGARAAHQPRVSGGRIAARAAPPDRGGARDRRSAPPGLLLIVNSVANSVTLMIAPRAG
jgi:hypothetical protein